MAGPPPFSGRIKKGEVRNPGGGSKKAREVAKIRRMTSDEVCKVGTMLLEGDLESLVAIHNDPEASIMQRLTAKLLMDCWKKGDITIWRAVLDRVVGKPKESSSIELTGANAGPLQFSAMSDAELKKQLAEIEGRNAKRKRR